MNSVPNSDSEQCTESKLGWVHRVHTQRTLAARTVGPGHTHCAQTERIAPRPRPHRVVLWRAVCRIASPAPDLSQAPSAVSWPCRCTHSHAGSAVSWCIRRRVVAYLATRLAAKPPSCHDTIVCIMTLLANQTARLSRYKDCIVTQPPAARPSLLSRYKTLYRDTHPNHTARALPAVSRALRAVLWRMLGRVVV